MKQVLAVVLMTLAATCAVAKDKPKDSDYLEGKLVSFERIKDGASCSSTGAGTVSDDGAVKTTGTTDCSSDYVSHYTIGVGDHVYVLSPGFSLFMKDTVLYLQPIGTAVKLRVHKSKAYVKVGDRESAYRIVGLR